jgi:hypothetical protein
MHITGFYGAATAQTQQQCSAPDPDFTITSCTAMIQSGREMPQNLAGAFYSRGQSADLICESSLLEKLRHSAQRASPC